MGQVRAVPTPFARGPVPFAAVPAPFSGARSRYAPYLSHSRADLLQSPLYPSQALASPSASPPALQGRGGGVGSRGRTEVTKYPVSPKQLVGTPRCCSYCSDTRWPSVRLRRSATASSRTVKAK